MEDSSLTGAGALGPAPARALAASLVGVAVRSGGPRAVLDPPSDGPRLSDSGVLAPARRGAPHSTLHRLAWSAWLSCAPEPAFPDTFPVEHRDRAASSWRSLASRWDEACTALLAEEGPPRVALLQRYVRIPASLSGVPAASVPARRPGLSAGALFVPHLGARVLLERWPLHFSLPPFLLDSEPGDDVAVLETTLRLWADAGLGAGDAERCLTLARSCTRRDPLP